MKPSRLLTHCITKTIPIGFLLRKHIFGFYYKLDLWYNSTGQEETEANRIIVNPPYLSLSAKWDFNLLSPIFCRILQPFSP